MDDPHLESLDSHASGTVFRMAAWFGIVAGLIEGILYLVLQELRWSSGAAWKLPASVEIIWIAGFFNALFYLTVALGLLVCARLIPRLPVLPSAVFFFSAMSFVIFLQFPGKIHPAGVVVLALGLAAAVRRWYKKRELAAIRFWKQTTPWAVGLAIFSFLAVQGGLWARERHAIRNLPPHSPNAPNILVIVVDTLRADHLSLYGYPRATSPHLDALARRSVWFENAVATSSWTLPSHASLLTGRYPHEHGAEKVQYDGRFPTLAEALEGLGYRTGAFSANQYWFGRREGFARGFIRFADYFQNLHAMAVRPFYGRMLDTLWRQASASKDLPARKLASDVTAASWQWMASDRDKPFFAILNYFDPHKPYLPPEPYLTKFAASRDKFYATAMFDGNDFTQMTSAQMQRDIDSYDGAISFVDQEIDHLLGDLQARGILSNTLVVITSDHGESFGEHGMYTHRNALYLEGIRVPLILSWMGHLPAGVQVKHPVSIAALPATLLETLGQSRPAEFPVPSLVHWWREPSLQTEEPTPLSELAHLPEEPFKRHPVVHGAMKSLLSPQYHYIVHDKFGPELYDWVQDPPELNNLIRTPEGKKIAEEFSASLQRMLTAPARASARNQPR